MGKVYSFLTRPIRSFNIENRAARVISREKPVAAPQYKYVEQQKKFVDKVNPNFLEEHYQKNVQLDQRLKDVFVTSMDPQGTMEPSQSSRSLPQDRYKSDVTIINYYEPVIIPAGKCSLKQTVTFLGRHKRDPIKYSMENIAVEHNMDKEIVGDILNYFHLFNVTQQEYKSNDEPLRDIGQQKIEMMLGFDKNVKSKTNPDNK